MLPNKAKTAAILYSGFTSPASFNPIEYADLLKRLDTSINSLADNSYHTFITEPTNPICQYAKEPILVMWTKAVGDFDCALVKNL